LVFSCAAYFSDILDDIQELASEPVADPEPLRSKIEAFLRGVERELTNGEEAGE
jgi:hypothetical protein